MGIHIKIEWARVDESAAWDGTDIAKVFGGWVIRERTSSEEGDAIALVFIPDKEHLWEV